MKTNRLLVGLPALLFAGCFTATAPVDSEIGSPGVPGEVDPPGTPGDPAADPGGPVTPTELGNYDFAYVAWGDEGPEIRLGNLAGESHLLRRLEGGVELAGQLAVSPGGDRLAFTTFDYVRGGWSLRVMQLAHNHEREIAQDVGSSARPSWSPDGRWLAYTAYVNETSSYGVFVAAADNSRAPTRVAVVDAGYTWCIQPQWSPDGSELLYSAQDQIVAYQPSSTQSRVVVAPGPDRRYCAAHWSPSGAEIAYSVIDNELLGPGDENARLERAPRDGGAPVLITYLRGSVTADQLRWRPDGQALAYVDYDAALNGAVLFQIDRDGGTAEIVDALDAGIDAGTPAWSPDGKTLLYVRFQEGARLSAFDAGSGGVSDLGIEGASIAGTYPVWLRQQPSQDL